jgi:ATP-binding cassette, subfamily B, bacterial
MIFTLILFTMQLAMPIFFKMILDVATDEKLIKAVRIQKVLHVFYYILFVALANNICWRFIDVFSNRFVFGLKRKIFTECFSYLNGHSYRFFTDNLTGALIKRLNRFINAMETIFSSMYYDIWGLFFAIIWTSAVIFYQNFYIWIFFVFYIILFWIVAYFLTKPMLVDRHKFIQSDTKFGWYIADVISNHFNLLLFANHKKEMNTFSWLLEENIELQRRYYLKSSILFGIIWSIFTLSDIAIYYLVLRFWWADYISIWVFILVVSYQYQLGNRIFNLPSIIRRFNEIMADINDMKLILDMPHEITDKEDAKKIEVLDWKIEFNDVTFKYNHKWEEVLQKFSLNIKPWEKVALVWVSGSGKSTIIKLMLRLFDLDSWNIRIDWQDISQVTQESLRKNISLVPQEPILFHRSLFENISYPLAHATMEEVVEASKKAQCHKFISHQEKWYDTMVWERWIKLSGWERQRVAIARALLENAKILLLDEATSSLDSESEILIQKAIEKAMHWKTTIAIAHRLSTIMKMDRIVVLERWKVVEDGNHEELLKKENWVYKKLWDIQSGWFIWE